MLYGRTLGVGVGCEEPLDQPTPSPCVSLPREDQEQEVSFVLPNRLARLVHVGLVLLMCGPIQASGQHLSVIICLCFIVSAITDEADANSGGQQQRAGSYRCCLTTAVGLGYNFKLSVQSLDKSHLEFAWNLPEELGNNIKAEQSERE